MNAFKFNVSRRALLRGTTLLALGSLGFGLMPLDAEAKKPTLSQKQAHYQTTPKDGHTCAGCRHFIADKKACDLVKGTISPNGWCMMWSAKG
jgi:hypothetical protein